MITGEYQYSLDTKKRLAIPAKLRGQMGERVVITRGPDQCLFVYPYPVWEEIAKKLAQLPIGQEKTRAFVRLMFSSAEEVTPDALGRILIPDPLKTYADLKREVTVVGVLNRLEIWDKDRWIHFRSSTEKEMVNMAEKLGELGMY
jgi:MraZ protein